jgi:hypothetical protein
MVTAIGSKGSSVKPGEVESFSIERADNGFTARIRTKQKPLRKNEVRDWDAASELEVFQTIDGLVERVREAFSGVKLDKKAA